jgi:hypothetical protein
MENVSHLLVRLKIRWRGSRVCFLAPVLCAVWSVTAVAACNDGSLISPAAATVNEVSALLHHRDFAKLNQLAEKYRVEKSLGEDGKPNLLGFYSGVSNAIANCGDVKQSEKQWTDHRKLLLDWRKVSPNAVAPTLALAQFMTAYAWHARGSGYSSTVTQDGQKLFDERIEEAKAQLQKMDADARNNPEWYVGMLKVALAQGWDKPDFDALFREAIAKFPTYYPLYNHKASFYNPKWYGSNEEFQAFLNATVQATAPELGETMYARLEASQGEREMFRTGQADWKRMAAGLDRINKDFPGPWNLNVYAKYACFASDIGSLRRLLGKIGQQVSYSAWGSKDQYESCRKFANDRFCWKWADDNTTECEPLENVPVKKF